MKKKNTIPKASQNHELLKTIFPNYQNAHLSDKYYDERKYEIKDKHRMYYD